MKGIQRIYKNPFYIHIKKHKCPDCKSELYVIKVTKIVNSKSPEAKYYDFSSGDTYLVGDVKFIWNEFECGLCGRRISIDKMKEIEMHISNC